METNNQKNDQNIIPNDADKQQKGVNVPNLRFPNFNSVWQKNKFGNLLTLLKNNTLSRAELNYENGKIKNIHYGDVLIKFNDFVLSDSKIIPYINDDSIPHNYADLLLKTGDLIIADTAEDYTVGKATELIFNDQSLIISGLHTIPCRPINNIFGSKYLGYYINSPSFHNQLLPLIQGIKVSSISKSQIVDTFISYPKINEQCKITEFLTLIDQRIDTQSKIIEDLESFKKGIWNYIYLTKSSDWKCVKLSDILCERKDFALKGDAFIHATLSKDGIFAKTDRYDRDFLVTNDEKEYKITRLNDICYNPANLKFGVICLNKFGDAIFSPIYVTYIVKNDFIPSFVELILTSSMFLKYIRKYEQGTVYERMAVNSEDFLKGEILIPTKDKQKAIADYFDMLDLKIKKEKDILELYKKQKAYLLKNMFI